MAQQKELTGVDRHGTHIDLLHSTRNYPSAKAHKDAIEAAYIENSGPGMALGPLTETQAASQLCHRALADKLEGRYLGKLRTTHDGTVCDISPWKKKNNTTERQPQACMAL